MTYVRPEIRGRWRGYVPGEQPQAGKFIKLNTNENPYPPSPAVVRAIQQAAAARLMRYPDPMATAFRIAAGRRVGRRAGLDLCGNGSDDILTIVTRALRRRRASCCGCRIPATCCTARWPRSKAPDTRKSTSSRTGRCRRLCPGRARQRPETGLSAQPQQPVRHGSVRPSAILELADRLPCPLLVDEAYADFADDELRGAGHAKREDHGLADAEQVVRVGRAAIRLRRRPAARSLPS